MRCLTVKEPWASLLVHGLKTIESRTWATKHRGQVVICSAAAPHDEPWSPEMVYAVIDMPGGRWLTDVFPGRPWQHGYALGTVNVVDTVPNDHVYPTGADYETSGFTGEDAETGDGGWCWAEPAGELTGDVLATALERALGFYEEHGWAWLLSRPRRFTTPVKVRGRLGLWTPAYDEHAAIQDQIEAAAGRWEAPTRA